MNNIIKYIAISLCLAFIVGQINAEVKVEEESRFQGKTTSEWIAILKSSESKDERNQAAVALKEIGPTAFVAAMNEEGPVGSWGQRELISLGPKAAPAVPALVEILEKGHDVLPDRAAFVLSKIGPKAIDAVPALKKALKDEKVRLNAALALGKIAPTINDWFSVLTIALKDKDKQVRAKAASNLGGIGTPAKDAVPVLIDALNDEYYYVRANSAWALGNIGPAAKDAVSALRVMSKKDDHDANQLVALQALNKIERATR